MDVWNGNVAQCQSFVNFTGITYPMLRLAGPVSTSYAGGYEDVFVVDQAGVIQMINLSHFESRQVEFTIDALLATPTGPSRPAPFVVDPPWPNPFNPRTTIAFELPGQGQANVDVRIMDQRGRSLLTLLQRPMARGQRVEIPWTGQDRTGTLLPSGVYQVVVSVDGTRETRAVTLLK